MASDDVLLLPRESAKYISEKSQCVSIDQNGIAKLSTLILSNIKSGSLSISAYGDDGLHPGINEKNLVDWMFVIDTLNFCFWTPSDATKWKVCGETGYLALCAAIRRAIGEGKDISDPKVYSTITEEELSHIFRSDDDVTPVPLLSTRVECLHEVGTILLEKFDGTFKNCIIQAEKSAIKLLDIVVTNFPCFRDETVFEGKRVAFYKRAQILVADLWSRFLGKDLGEFSDIAQLTMFADYRVPQVLVHFGAMKYTDELLAVLNKGIIESGSREEIEIRGCSIHAVELIDSEVKQLIQSEADCSVTTSAVNSVLIDYFLWMYRRDHAAELEYIPFHKVLGKFY